MPRSRKPADEDTKAEEPSEGKTVKLKYTGPPDQVVLGLNEKLVSGESYDVPADIAEALVAGSAHWEK